MVEKDQELKDFWEEGLHSARCSDGAKLKRMERLRIAAGWIKSGGVMKKHCPLCGNYYVPTEKRTVYNVLIERTLKNHYVPTDAPEGKTKEGVVFSKCPICFPAPAPLRDVKTDTNG